MREQKSVDFDVLNAVQKVLAGCIILVVIFKEMRYIIRSRLNEYPLLMLTIILVSYHV